MWQKQNKDNPVFNLALLVVLATTAMGAAFMLPELIRAESTKENTNFKLPQNVPTGTKVLIHGSSDMAAINQGLKSSIEKRFSGTEIEIVDSNTEGAIKAVLASEADIAAINHELTPEEKAQGLKQIVLHRDKIAIIVGKENPFQGSLTIEQFARIFRGEITDWSELGGSPGKIQFIDRPTASDIRQAFLNYPVFQKGKFATGANAIQIDTDDTAKIIEKLGKDGISYVPSLQLTNVSTVRTLSLHKIQPDNPKYPFSLPSVYIYRQNPSPQVNTFLGFTSNQPGQDAIQTAIANEANTNAQKLGTQAANSGEPSNPEPSPESTTTATSNTESDNINPDASKDSSTNTGNADTGKGIGAKTVSNDSQSRASSIINNRTTSTNAYEGLSWWWQLLLGGLGALGLLSILHRKKSKEVKPETATIPPTPGNGYDDTHNQPGTITPSPEKIVDKNSDPHDSSLDLEAPVAVVNPSYPSPYGEPEDSGETDGIGNVETSAVIAAGIGGIAGAAALNKKKQNEAQEYQSQFSSESLDMVADAAEPSLMRNATTNKTTLFLSTESEKLAQAKWTIFQEYGRDKSQSGEKQLVLRLYDVTDIDLSYQSPKLVKQYECKQEDNNLVVDIPLSDRNYMAELGYADSKDGWFAIARSNIIRVFSTFVGESSTNTNLGPLDGIKVATAGVATAAAASFWSSPSTTENGNVATISAYPNPPIQDGESSIILVNRTPKWAYASWYISAAQQTELQHQGGKQLALRLYDVTDIDLSYQEPKLVQQYECDQTTNDRFVATPIRDRNYMAEIGYITDEERWLLLARSATIRVLSHQGQGFWFVADAELLIHGATEPDATVTIGDRHIKLKQDGTFHLRIPFTDRLIDCIMEAHDNNSEQVKMVHKQFSTDSLMVNDGNQ
ncbi:hypothetical protein RintRC_1669 [Richelia intracellularis]|nr:hypothetical protein RintRC_3764 [Richelia intracellularis]CDN12375.1 hypothetical protein RintRC_1669 [Richelia intracellularis]